MAAHLAVCAECQAELGEEMRLAELVAASPSSQGDVDPAWAVARKRMAASPRGARVLYEADLHLKGPYRVAEPLLGATFRRMGDAALEGLAARLQRAA